MASSRPSPMSVVCDPTNKKKKQVVRKAVDSDDDSENEVCREDDLSLSGLDLEELDTQAQGACGGASFHDIVATQDEEEEDSLFDNLDLNETRKMAFELMETCQELELKQGFQENEDALIAQQVKHSQQLFDMQFGLPAVNKRMAVLTEGGEGDMTTSNPLMSPLQRGQRGLSQESNYSRLSQLSQLSQEQSEVKVVGEAAPSTMMLLYKHTQMCAGLVRKRAQALGENNSEFSVEAYLASVRKLGDNELGEYSSKRAMERVVQETNKSIKTFPSFPSMLGAFDHREFVEKLANAGEEQEKVKPESVKAKRGKMFDTTNKPDAHEVVNSQKANSTNNAGEETSNEFRSSLVDLCKKKQGPANIFEFTLNKDSIQETLNNTFEVAFGVRDGSIALNTQGKSNAKNLNLTVQPCAPPKKASSKKEGGNRQQCIMSISSKMLRELQALAQGEAAIQPTASSSKNPDAPTP